MKSQLPIDALLPECAKNLEEHSTLILQASPGSGKTTRLPPFLLYSSVIKKDSQIWVLEPRRLAAKFAATRVAEEEQVRLGDLVGYHFRFEKQYCAQTRLLYLTEGMLMRRLVHNPYLLGVSMVVLDEFHERHLHTDLALSFLTHLQTTKRPDLKIVVMSATLETERLQQFLPEAPILRLEAPLFPVISHFLETEKSQKSLSVLVREVLEKEWTRNSYGDCLVFLPGMREIRACESELKSLSHSFKFLLLPLHGEIPKEEQEKAILPQSMRKVVLATNIAETSLTIPGITLVIDSGLQRTASYSWWTGVPMLATKKTSKASCIQRAGRAGRTAPGICWYLFTKHDFESRPNFAIPEIQKADLAQTVLELKALGVSSLLKFPWFEKPSPASLDSSQQLLFHLGALDSKEEEGQLTPLGKEMKEFSVHPRISRFLIACRERNCLEKGIHLATLLSEGKLQTLDALDSLNHPLDFHSLRLQKQLHDAFVYRPTAGQETSKNSPESSDALSLSLLEAFSDRVAMMKPNSQQNRTTDTLIEFVLASGGTATLMPGTQFSFNREAPYVIALEVQESKRAQRSFVNIHSLVSIKECWLYDLEPSPLSETEKIEWNKIKQKLTSFSQILLGQLILDSKERTIVDEDLAFEVLLKELFKVPLSALPSLSFQNWVLLFKIIFPQNEVERLLVRIQLFQTHQTLRPESPRLTTRELSVFLKFWLQKKRTLAEISDPQCLLAIENYFCRGEEYGLNKKLPCTLKLPNQKLATINYSFDRSPWVESRMQDFFGLTEAPALCDGKVPLTLHFLAPNYRAVQVTTDLQSFWNNHYPSIRKELSRNYPRHPWPENPRIPLPPSGRKKV